VIGATHISCHSKLAPVETGCAKYILLTPLGLTKHIYDIHVLYLTPQFTSPSRFNLHFTLPQQSCRTNPSIRATALLHRLQTSPLSQPHNLSISRLPPLSSPPAPSVFTPQHVAFSSLLTPCTIRLTGSFRVDAKRSMNHCPIARSGKLLSMQDTASTFSLAPTKHSNLALRTLPVANTQKCFGFSCTLTPPIAVNCRQISQGLSWTYRIIS